MNLPTDTWVAVAKQNIAKRVYDVYLFKQHPDGSRTAMKGGNFHKVPEGCEMPVYIQLSTELKHFMSAFKHAYVVEQTVREWSEHVTDYR